MSDPAPHPKPTQVWFLIVDHRNMILRGMRLGFVKVPTDSCIGNVAEAMMQKAQLTVPDNLLQVYMFSGDLDVVDDIKRQEQIVRFFRESPDELEERGTLQSIGYSRENDVLVIKLPARSSQTSNEEYLNRFRSIFDRSIQDPVKKVVLRDGDQCALPVSIMHPTLAKLAHRMKVLDDDVRTAYVPNGNQVSLRTGKSMLLDRALVNSSRIFYQSLYELYQAEGDKMVNVLDAFLISFLGEEQDGYGRQGSNLADATWSVFPHDDRTLRFHLVIAKSKSNEHSLGDASLQGAYWYETNMHFMKEMNIPSLFPVVIIAMMGTVIEVSIAIYHDAVAVMDKVLRLELHSAHNHDVNVIRLALMATALKECVEELRREYVDLSEKILKSGFSETDRTTWYLPHPTFLQPASLFASSMKLKFRSKLNRLNEPVSHYEKRGMLFLADYSPGEGCEVKEVLVKFTAKYNECAHELLAKAELAPELYACEPVMGGLIMVVMERLNGERMRRSATTPSTVLDDIERAVKILHSANIVFGDLRGPNVIVVTDGKGEKRAKLIDFDWAGRPGEAIYPVTLNTDLVKSGELAPDVKILGLIRKEHDEYALRFLCQKE